MRGMRDEKKVSENRHMGVKGLEMVCKCFAWFEIVLHDFPLCCMILDGEACFEIVLHALKW